MESIQISAHTPLRTRVFRWIVSRWLHAFFRIRVSGIENIPAGGYIIYANHTSWIDSLLMLITLPPQPRAYIIADAKGLRALWKRPIVWLVGCVLEHDRNSADKAIFSRPVQALRAGAILALFPEGIRRDEEGTIAPFRRGIGHFARQADATLLPVAYSGAYDLYWQKEIAVTIGKPFRVDTAGLDERAAADAIVQRAEDELRAILPPYVEPVVAKKRLHWLKDALN